MQTNWRGARRLAAIAVIGVLVLSACGDDDDDASPTTTPTTAAEQPGDGEPGAGGEIVFGMVNLEGGAVSLPEFRIGAEVAVDHVNDDLGGAGGRTLRMIRCDTDLSPEKSIDCANRFVEEGVAFVFEGVDTASDAMLPILADAGIPLIGHNAFGPQQQVADNTFFLGFASPAAGAGTLKALADQGAESVAIVIGEGPTGQSFADDILTPTAEQLGVELKIVMYAPGSPDWGSVAASALSESPDAVGTPAMPEPDCVGFVGAVRATGFTGPLFAGACSFFVQALPAEAVGVQTYYDYWIAQAVDDAPAERQDEIATYVEEMTAAGQEDLVEGFAQTTFSDIVTLASILGGIDGEIDGAAVTAAMESAIGVQAFMGQEISCDGTAWPGQTACAPGLLVYEVQADGTKAAITDDFIDPRQLD